ncbi:MAG: tRNA 2-thiouridine(34) synthase MnmA [Alphaproteobacteria bacterium]|nr:tRNA 2-thiouridine(34) synthase MnmA [Alphaproteobacteria bacterium]
MNFDLGLPAGSRVVAAMSGGVDSAVAAALAKAAGHEVIGVTLQLYDQRQVVAKAKSCCAGRDVRDAARAAERLGIRHYVLDYEALFRQRVIRDFAADYAAGRTPIPCVRCNQRIKFADLMDFARDLGAAALVTGHYARRVAGPEGAELHVAADPARDQSYFLFATTRAQLAALRWPLGDFASKQETRRLAAEFGLDLADKPDSQDICFVPDGDYAAMVGREAPEALAPGEIVDAQGAVLGRHEGIARFTIGQRKGLGVAAGAPRFVTAIDPVRRRVVIGDRARLARESFGLTEVNWLGQGRAPPAAGMECRVKIRSAHRPAAARVKADRVELEAAEFGIAPGQACVFYRHGRVLGGGFIARDDAERSVA